MHKTRLTFLSLLALLCIAIYLFHDIRGSWEFALTLRIEKLLGLAVVAVSISVSTLLFHTITGNRILTPSIMGFDALYILILSGIIFLFGANSYLGLSNHVLFLMNAGLLILASFLIFSTLLTSYRADIMRMVLTGIIVGVCFRALSSLVQRMIDPSEFAIIADSSFASFASIDADLLLLALPICVFGVASAWMLRHKLDILALGPSLAINLGEDPRKGSLIALAIISLLVSTATALVGPVAFLGLLVVNLAYFLTPSPFHSIQMLSSSLISIIALVGGQVVMERIFHFTTPLSIIIDVLGGVVFLILVLKRVKS